MTLYSCAWSLRAQPGQHISVSWRLPSASGSSDGRGPRLRRPVGPCPATIVFVDGDDGSRPPSETVEDRRSTSALHATTCSVGSRTEPRLIYTSKTNRLHVRPTDVILARLMPLSHADWRPYLLEYRSTFTLV